MLDATNGEYTKSVIVDNKVLPAHDIGTYTNYINTYNKTVNRYLRIDTYNIKVKIYKVWLE